MIIHTADEIETFVSRWASEHVKTRPSPINLLLEVDRLASQLTGDARASGISGGDIFRIMGDIDVYLTEKFEQASIGQD